MSKSVEDAITIIERMALCDHQIQYNGNPSQRKDGIIELGTTDAMLAPNKLLAQAVEKLTKQLSKLPQQLKEILEVSSKPKHVAYCELCSGDHAIGYCPPSNEEVNYMETQQRQGQYQNTTDYQRRGNSNYGKGCRQDAGPSNKQYQNENYNQHSPQQNHTSKLGETLNKFMEMTMSAKVIGKGIGDNLETERVGVELKEKQEGEKEESEKEIENNVEKLFSKEGTSMNNPYKIKLPYPLAPTKKIVIEEKVIEENEDLEKVVVEEKDQNEGKEKELGEKEEENNQERVKVNKAEIDEVVESICALFNKQLRRRRTWTPHHLYFKFMQFLPNKLKSKDDVLSVSFWPP
jgi:hypothetical protein